MSVNGSMLLGGPKAAEVGAISGLKLRKWRALARQEARASAPAKAAEVGDLPDPYFPPEFRSDQCGCSLRMGPLPGAG